MKAIFTGACARCKALITAELEFESEGADVKPPPIIGSYHACGANEVNLEQAVPLTLREAV